MPTSKIVRPPGLIVFALVVLGLALLWWMFADRLVQRGVEATGESMVGARVELESVDLRPTEGSIRMIGLQVANPDAPMTNLFEAGEIVVDLLLEPLLTKKVVVQNLVMTGVRFNTPRETSGALENPDPEAGRLWRNVNSWADDVRASIPSFSLETLTGSVRTEAISADSLRTVQYARRAVSRVDSMRTSWESQLRSLDPRPRIDTLQAVVQRLEAFRPTPLNALQIPSLLQDGRGALNNLTSLQAELAALDDAVREGVASLAIGAETIAELRAQDLAYAQRLLNIPSLDAPSISPALFGGTALTWMKPVLYWARNAERFLPPGLDPRRRPGPQRARAEGTTVEFPGRATYPAFLLQQGEIGMEIVGTGLSAGAYTATLRGLTSSPALLGEPMVIELGRTAGAQGPTGFSLSAVLDHTGDVLRDSGELALSGVSLPEVDLGPLGGRVDLGLGESTFSLRRTGEQIEARLDWASTDLSWSRAGGQAPSATPPQLGTAEWARDLVWRTLTGIERVELGMGLSGTLERPSLSVTSNLGEAVGSSLRRELGEQIQQAETRLRQEVDSRIQPIVQEAR
ncbi:MAG TPA: TIGR03545 family protein, partial [Longimicrobiales bacterium]|nr:TIGR03545 family protein [Longimicrobiales bacterium]